MRTSAPGGTRERILNAAEEFFGERGYHGTRLHHIAQAVGVQKASLFHYFPSKADLYRAVLAEGFGETEQTIRRVLATEEKPFAKARALVAAYVDMVTIHPARTKILLRQSLGDAPPDHEPSELERLLKPVVEFIEEGQRAGVFAPVDPVALVLGVIGMVVFFFTSVPVLAPVWFGAASGVAHADRIKRHVVTVIERCLAGDAGPAVVASEHRLP